MKHKKLKNNKVGIIPNVFGGQTFSKLIEIYNNEGYNKVYFFIKTINTSNKIKADAYTFLSKFCRNKKNYLHAAKFARFAYNIDPKLFRRKFLAFRLASTFDYLESDSLLKTFKNKTIFSTLELKKIEEVEENTKNLKKKKYSPNKGIADFNHIFDEFSELNFKGILKSERLFSDKINSRYGIFLESAWNGNDGYWNKALVDKNFTNEKSKKIFIIIKKCKELDKKFIFWNKEDPLHRNKFLHLSKLSDYLFTTDEESVNFYKKELDHKNVFLLPFGFNEFIFNPSNKKLKLDDIFFAGGYYNYNHQNREKQLKYILPLIKNFNGTIYDRHENLNNERYFFPKEYQKYIKPTIPFVEMANIYKNYKLALNVNSISDSSSMLSRRVFEILACGVPIVSSSSKALDHYFKNIVYQINNKNEGEKIIRRLITKNNHEYKNIAHIGYRECMRKHTMSSRVTLINKIIGKENENADEWPLISIVLPSNRRHELKNIYKNLFCQNYPNIEILFGLTNFKNNDFDYLNSLRFKNSNIKKVEFLNIPENMSLGKKLNTLIKNAKGSYIAKMDDDDIYMKNYLWDLSLPFKFTNCDIVGKKTCYSYLKDMKKSLLRSPGYEHVNTNFINGATFIFKKKVWDKIKFDDITLGEDTSFLEKIKKNKLSVYSSDSLNYMNIRYSDLSKHTFKNFKYDSPELKNESYLELYKKLDV